MNNQENPKEYQLKFLELQKALYALTEQNEQLVLENLQIRKDIDNYQFLIKETRDAANLSVWKYNIDNQITSWSTQVYNILEVETSISPIKWEKLDLLTPLSKEKIKNAFELLVKTGQVISEDLELMFPNGKHRCLKIIGSLNITKNIILGTIHLIGANDQNKLEKEKLVDESDSDTQFLTKELEIIKEHNLEKERIKSAFFANMNHDIRTPMNGILGLSKLLLKKDISEENKQKYIEILNTNANQLLNTLTDLINVSKIELGLTVASAMPVNINKLLFDIEKKVRPNIYHKDIILVPSKQFPDSESSIATDYIKLRQILNNLISNAIRFTEHGRIDFGYTLKYPDIEFFVKDTGCGISFKNFDKIFQRFKQTDIQNYQTRYATGLGLSITKEFVQILGGNIWLSSEVNKGTSFYFTIPYTPINEGISMDNNPNTEVKVSKYDWSKFTILVVEDDFANTIILEELLRVTKINALFANSGIAAINLFKTNSQIDIILMDVKMPEMNGLDATQIIRTYNKSVPIIAQTAFVFSEDRKLALKAGCNDYISKPIDSEILLTMLNEYLTAK